MASNSCCGNPKAKPNQNPKADVATLQLPGVEQAGRFFVAAQRAQVLAKHGVLLDRADRTRQRWDRRWAEALVSVWPGAKYDRRAADAGIEAARAVWGRVSKAEDGGPREPAAQPPAQPARPTGPVPRPTPTPPDLIPDIERAIVRQLGSSESFLRRAEPVFQSLARDTSEDAGQHTLDLLGLNATFRWTTARDMPDRLFAVRGSKVLLHSHGAQVQRLAEIVADATDPARPAGQTELRRRIREEWPGASAKAVARVARTESANVWEQTNYNVARANGITEFDWVIAHGPSIGPPKSYPVCPRCLKRAAEGPYSSDDPNWTIPPRHPNCRCTLIPKLAADWLPPAETWDGGPEPPLPLVGRKAEWEP